MSICCSSPTLSFPAPRKQWATGVGPPAGNHWRQDDENYDGRGHPPNPPIRPARPSVKPLDGGYDCEFVKRPASDLGQADCPVCLLVLREPQLASCCGYSFCRNCIQRVQTSQNVCPACNEQFTVVPNKGLKRALCGQKVYCVHRGLGCEWEGNWESLIGTSTYTLRQRNCSRAASFLRWSALSAPSLSSVAISKLTSLMTAPSVPLHASIATSMKLPLRRSHRATGQCALPFPSPAPTTAT